MDELWRPPGNTYRAAIVPVARFTGHGFSQTGLGCAAKPARPRTFNRSGLRPWPRTGPTSCCIGVHPCATHRAYAFSLLHRVSDRASATHLCKV